MKMIALIALSLFIVPTIAGADEPADKARCNLAVQAQNWSGAINYCHAIAQDYAVDASSHTGHERAIDLILEGVSMGQVGIAYDNEERYDEAASAKAAARLFLSDAQTQTSDPNLLALIQSTLEKL